MKNICLIIPCYNEEKRINLEIFKQSPNIVFIFVNDGSKDKTYELLKSNLDNANNYILNLENNVGKAEAVRQGMLFALSLQEKFEWIGFLDADLAIPINEIKNFIIYHEYFYKDFEAVFGSRVQRLGSNIKKVLIRNILGKLFAKTICIIFKLNFYDSQCGAKIFKKNIIEKTFNKEFISKWLFDIEILMRLKKHKIVEYPLKQSIELNNSNIRILNELPKVFFDVIKIWKKYKNQI